jgi:cysteine-rich repeat protein
VIEPPEVCDDQNQVSGDGCDSSCRPTGCGSGVVTAGEDCDDGNTFNCDACPKDCRNSTAPVACATPATNNRHPQKIQMRAPEGFVLSGAAACIDYPPGVVALPGTGNVATGGTPPRLSGLPANNISTLNDFNNAVQLTFALQTGQPQVEPVISFDLCVGATAPPPTAFQCAVKSASSSGATLDPTTVVCVPVNP